MKHVNGSRALQRPLALAFALAAMGACNVESITGPNLLGSGGAGGGGSGGGVESSVTATTSTAATSTAATTSSGCDTACDCGNGAVDPGEACDDGNLANGDGCSATCAVEPPLAGVLFTSNEGTGRITRPRRPRRAARGPRTSPPRTARD